MRTLRLSLFLIAGTSTILMTQSAFAISYFVEDMYDWSTADAACTGQTTLSYTDDQIRMLVSKFDERSNMHTRIAWFDNDAWSSDIAEDQLSGQDNSFADTADFYAYSGHGNGPVVDGVQKFTAPMRTKSAGYTEDCHADSTKMKLGDNAGTYFSTPSPGNARWIMWLACYSVDVNPDQQWFDVFQGRLQYVMGYRNTSVDSSNTDDVAATFANDAYVWNRYEFKATWFSAIEDWWFNDTGEVFTRGTSSTNASWRRDHLTSGMLDDGAQNGGWWAYSYHQG